MRITHNPRPQAPKVTQEPKIEEIFIEEIEVEAEEEVEVVKETKLIYSEEENRFILIEED